MLESMTINVSLGLHPTGPSRQSKLGLSAKDFPLQTLGLGVTWSLYILYLWVFCTPFLWEAEEGKPLPLYR